MADVFLSYASQDRERVRALVERLEEHGWSVWWDRHIPPGMTWPQVIEQALADTRAMVVVWTAASVTSKWVQIETAEGEALGALVPLSFDRVKLPLQFRLLQSADLIAWDGSRTHPEFRTVVAQLERLLGAISDAPTRKRKAVAKRVAPAARKAKKDATARKRAKPEAPSREADERLNPRIHVTGGSFSDGSPMAVGGESENPRHRVTLSSLYRRFVPNHDPSEPADHPVVRVSWDEATAYASWLGGSLPTEAVGVRGPRGGRAHVSLGRGSTHMRPRQLQCVRQPTAASQGGARKREDTGRGVRPGRQRVGVVPGLAWPLFR